MNNNPYDTSVEWINFHRQQTEDMRQYEATHLYPLTPSYQREKIRPAPTSVRRLSKSEALERVSYLKGFIIGATLLGFGTLGGLVANQMFTTNTPLNQSQGAPTVQAPSQQDPFPSWRSDSGGFFKRHEGGYGFGQDNNSGPFSGSHTS
ncbi:MAG: hypothetical protein JO011_22100 [Ktedonobacteraceae bacterium]|nr:hypothetical protein [Ktedonobacteraceae bacterium]